MGCEQADQLVDVFLGDRLVKGPLDLADLVRVGFPLDSSI
jgi:hypothetical protein